MSTKKRHALNHWWHMLHEVEEETQRDATAGQVARHAGVSRNTAKLWLDRLCDENAAFSIKYIGRNGFSEIRYHRIGSGE